MAASKRPGSSKDGATEPEARLQLARWLKADRAVHLGLADALEALADQLPGRVDPDLVVAFLPVLEQTWGDHVRSHEELILPLLSHAARANAETRAELALLEREHYQIAGANDEVIEQLMRLSLGERLNYETLGYILRGAFEGRRRHLDWETAFHGRVLLDRSLELEVDRIARWCGENPPPILPKRLQTALRFKSTRLVLS